MRRPRLSRHMVLERPVETPDGGGGVSRAWERVCTLWAEIDPSTGREDTIGDRPASRVTHRITVRRGADPAIRPAPDCRLRHGSRIFAIRAVAEADALPGRAYLTVWAEEGLFS